MPMGNSVAPIVIRVCANHIRHVSRFTGPAKPRRYNKRCPYDPPPILTILPLRAEVHPMNQGSFNKPLKLPGRQADFFKRPLNTQYPGSFQGNCPIHFVRDPEDELIPQPFRRLRGDGRAFNMDIDRDPGGGFRQAAIIYSWNRLGDKDEPPLFDASIFFI
jgi:hypothetical protein